MSKEFINNKVYKIAYKTKPDALDVELTCPNCGCTSWIFQNRTGTGKLPKDQIKLKCKECGQWFICNKKDITEILGG